MPIWRAPAESFSRPEIGPSSVLKSWTERVERRTGRDLICMIGLSAGCQPSIQAIDIV